MWRYALRGGGGHKHHGSTYGGQKTTLLSWFLPNFMWVPEIRIRSLDLLGK